MTQCITLNGTESVEWLREPDRGIDSAAMPWVFWPAALRASTGPHRLLSLWKVGLGRQIDQSVREETRSAACGSL